MRSIKFVIGNKNQDFVNKYDIALISIFIVFALLVYSLLGLGENKEHDSLIAIVKHDNNEIYKIDLNNVKEPYYLPINNEYHSKIFVENRKICFEKADCPDKICVNTGKLYRPGQIAVCLPAKLIIEIKGEKLSADAVTG